MLNHLNWTFRESTEALHWYNNMRNGWRKINHNQNTLSLNWEVKKCPFPSFFIYLFFFIPSVSNSVRFNAVTKVPKPYFILLKIAYDIATTCYHFDRYVIFPLTAYKIYAVWNHFEQIKAFYSFGLICL